MISTKLFFPQICSLSSICVYNIRFFCENKKIYDHRRDYSKSTHIDWFITSNDLTNKRMNNNLPHIAFLEGPHGSGKKEILGRLKKLGYTIQSPNYFNYFKDFNNSTKEKQEEQLYNDFISYISTLKENRENIKHKENIIFYNRSLLSIDKYFNSPKECKDLLYNIYPNYSLVMCIADPIVRKQRVGYRQFYGDNIDILQMLQEDNQEYLDKIANSYNNYFNNDKIFDNFIYSSSVRQGAAAILSLYGIKPKPIEKQ